MATLGKPQVRERSSSQGNEPTATEDNILKKRHTIAEVGTALIHVLKISKGHSSDNTMDTNPSPKGGVLFKNLRRPSESVDSKSDKTSTSIAAALQRRRSTFRNIACGITSMMKLRSLSTGKVEPLKPKIRYENSYRLGPDTGKHIAISETEKVAGRVLEDMIGEKQYDHIICGRLSIDISNRIKAGIKALNFPRYRIIVQVVISQANGQGLEAASRCLWDSKVDNYSCVTYRNDTVIAMALIYGVYLE
ncbi:Tctex1 domain-containing protein 1 [Mactra antiquata]